MFSHLDRYGMTFSEILKKVPDAQTCPFGVACILPSLKEGGDGGKIVFLSLFHGCQQPEGLLFL